MLPFIELLPGTPEYRQFLYNAIRSRDQRILKKIRDKYGKPIHIVSNWFAYHLMMLGQPSSYIVIYDKKALETYQLFEESLKNQDYE